MGDKTGIEWTEATWNPVSGCTKVSPGCKHCYAERDWPRLQHLPAYQGREFTDVATHGSRLEQPLRWTRPRRIFVNSMSDLFHCDVSDEFIDRVFAVMSIASHHTFQILTKRPGRMRDYACAADRLERIREAAVALHGDVDPIAAVPLWPLPNVWLGVSVEDQAAADERIPQLMTTPAAIHWVSAEPLLGPLDLTRIQLTGGLIDALVGAEVATGSVVRRWPGLDWVIVGAESGSKARPMRNDWAASIVAQCQGVHVPVLVKQLSGNGGRPIKNLEAFPAALRVRQYPEPEQRTS